MNRVSMLTKEDLQKYGMVETSGDEKYFYPMKKVLSAGSEECGELAICLTMQNNAPELVLATSDGELYIRADTVEELLAFEKCILAWEPNY